MCLEGGEQGQRWVRAGAGSLDGFRRESHVIWFALQLLHRDRLEGSKRGVGKTIRKLLEVQVRGEGGRDQGMAVGAEGSGQIWDVFWTGWWMRQKRNRGDSSV